MVLLYNRGESDVINQPSVLGTGRAFAFIAPGIVSIQSSTNRERPKQVTIKGIDLEGKRTVEFVGISTDQIAFSKNTYSFVQSVEVNGKKTNDGDLTVTDVEGNEIFVVKEGVGKSQVAWFKAPAGSATAIAKYSAGTLSPLTGDDVTVSLKVFDGEKEYVLHKLHLTQEHRDGWYEFTIPLHLNKGHVVVLEAVKSDGQGLTAQGSLEIVAD